MSNTTKKNVTKIGLAVAAVLALTIMSFVQKMNTISSPDQPESIYDLSIKSIDGESIDLASYKGKKILFVNVASKCGFTPQYEGLQKLHETYSENVVIIGIPCNQFLHQEPGSNDEIVSFCQKKYGVSFPLTEKVDVKGKNQHPIYTWLTSKSKNGVMDSKVKWNFQKYLVSENGELEEMFLSNVKPMDEKITSQLH